MRVLLQSFQKVYDQKNNFFEKNRKDIKNAEFHADFEFVEKIVINAHKKSYKQNKFDEHE